MSHPLTTPEHRAEFDARVTFANGGDLQVHGFRLDIPGDRISEEDVGLLLVRHLGLLMVDDVAVSNLRILAAPHKGSRAGPSDGAGTAAQAGGLIELSHTIVEGMVTYPGLPGPTFHDHLSRAASRDHYEPGTEFSIQRLEMVGNTGTYLDSPFHRYADGGDLASLDLATLVDLPAAVVHLDDSEQRGIGPTALSPYEVRGHTVLLHTGWDRHWGTERYGDPAPFLTADGARYLADAGAALVGIDSVNIDDTMGRTRPAHSILLGAGIPVVEHLTGLDQLPASGASFCAVPPRVAGFGTFPVRAYARIPA